MTFTVLNLVPVSPEIFVLGMACLALMVGVFFKSVSRWLVPWLVYFAIAGAAVITLQFYGTDTQVVFSGMFINQENHKTPERHKTHMRNR